MRKWRVGTISMGITLILLGVILLLSQFQGWDIVKLSLAWWPVILIVLGAEIVVYLFLSKQENPIVKYDFFSIMFIGMLGTIGIALYIFMSIGLLDEVKAAIHSENSSGTLPTVEQAIPSDIHKIIVNSSNYLSVETNKSHQLSIFGTYHSSFTEKEQLKVEDVVQVHQVGHNLYVQFLNPPAKQGFIYQSSTFNPTLSLPNDVEVEIREGGNLNISVEDINKNWEVDQLNSVTLDVNDSTIIVEAESLNQDLGWDVGWDTKHAIEDGNHQNLNYFKKTYGNGASSKIQFDFIQNLTIKQVGPRQLQASNPIK